MERTTEKVVASYFYEGDKGGVGEELVGFLVKEVSCFSGYMESVSLGFEKGKGGKKEKDKKEGNKTNFRNTTK